MKSLVLFCLLGMVLPRLAAAEEGTLVGILENLSPPEQKALETNYGIKGDAAIRVAFWKTESGWQAFDYPAGTLELLHTANRLLPKEVTWTIAFDGKARGSLTGATPGRWELYADIGRQWPVTGETIPRFGKPSERFASSLGEGHKVYRPLVLVSKPLAADPDGWKTAPLTGTDLGAARARFRAKITSENKELRYRDDDIKLVSAYRSEAGMKAFALQLDPKLNHDDGPPDSEWMNHWFLSDGHEPSSFLGRGLTLIDAGDYDGDGHSELIFMKSEENYDGYVLWDPEHPGTVEIGWSYH
ncbi:MAG TPA: hypothetical protein VKT70_05660 [Stellaceae bacterium]|nr:hypothetical protein [Stellaceae bacterium]